MCRSGDVANRPCVDERYHPEPSPSGKGDRRRRWMRGGTAFSIAGTAGAEVKPIEKAPLALPLGELSPQVTERALRRFLNDYVHLNHQRWPSPSSLRSATSPKGRGKGGASTDSPTVSTTFHAPPQTLIRLAHRRASFPQGKLLYRALGGSVYRYGVKGKRQDLPLRGRGTAVGGG